MTKMTNLKKEPANLEKRHFLKKKLANFEKMVYFYLKWQITLIDLKIRFDSKEIVNRVTRISEGTEAGKIEFWDQPGHSGLASGHKGKLGILELNLLTCIY